MACDAAVVKTGTSTLEAAVIGAPQIAVYDFGWIMRLEWVLLWMWKRIPFVAMPNIILERMAVPELLGPDSRPEAILIALKELLNNEVTRGRMQEDYREIRRLLGSKLEKPATLRVAEIIDEMLIPEQDGEMESAARG
jgi:lipid-A-disaccharide synthase